MSQSNTTRRGFLAALAPVALAGPLAAVPPPPPPRPKPPSFSLDELHRLGACPCADCAVNQLNARSPLLLNAIVALEAAKTALGRLAREHCDAGAQGGCNFCLDVDGCWGIVALTLSFLDGEVIGDDDFDARRKRARIPNRTVPAHAGALIALYDAKDALLDLTDGHCPDWNCDVCLDGDQLLYFLRVGIDHLGMESCRPLSAALLVEERELLSARRKVDRLRECEAEDAAFMPHSGREHCDPQHEVEGCEDSIALLRAVIAKKEGTGQTALRQGRARGRRRRSG